MSDAFSFMFAFYGLLLGLALAEIAAGFSRAFDERHVRKLGVATPLVGGLLLVDLITFWTNAWAYRELAEVTYAAALGVAAVSLLYYFAATQVFPKVTEREKLDDHIMHSRRMVMLCVFISNLMTQIPQLFDIVAIRPPLTDILLWAGLNTVYYILLAAVAFAPDKRGVSIAAGLAILYVAGATIVFS